MKGYWINHVIDVKDSERFSAYLEASAPLLTGENEYGAKALVVGPVTASIVGEAVQFAALIEFDSIQAAINFWNDPHYMAARLLLGPADDETASVDRRVCCIEAEPLTISPRQGFWLNHVHHIADEAAFYAYASASMKHFTGATFGPVVHQHAGQQRIQLAAALGFDSPETALGIYATPSYQAALAEGGMTQGETAVLNRTICVVTA